MSRRSREFSTKKRLALVLVNAVLLSAVAIRLWQGTAVGEVRESEAASIDLPAVDLEVPLARTQQDTIRTRAIFHSTRQFYVPPAPQPMEQKPAPPDYRVSGALAIPGKPIVALLTGGPGRPSVKVREGDMLDGWKVVAVTAKKVALKRDDEQIELQSTGPSNAAAGNPLQAAPMNPRPSLTASPGGVVVLGGGRASAGANGVMAPSNAARPVVNPRVP